MSPSPFSSLRHRGLLLLASLCATACVIPARMPAAELPGYEVVPLGHGNYNRLTLAATIENSKGLMILDTGASSTLLSSGKYSSLLPGPGRDLPSGVPKTANMNGTNARVGYARDFHIGKLNVGSLPLMLVSPHDLYEAKLRYAPQGARQYDGLVGEDILRHYNAIVDAGRLILYLNIDPKRRTNPGRGLVAAGWTRVPMDSYAGDYVVACTLGKERFRLIVDTGAPFTILDDHVVRASQARVQDLPMRSGIIGTTALQTSLVVTDGLSIGNYTARNVHLVSRAAMAMRGSGSSADGPVVGFLGGDILGSNNCALIDIGDKALYLKPATAKR